MKHTILARLSTAGGIIIAAILSVFMASNAALASSCGTNTGTNYGPPGSYQNSCKTFMQANGKLYAMCNGCGTTFSVLSTGMATCDSISNQGGLLQAKCIADSPVNMSFTKSSGCTWNMTTSGNLNITCVKGSNSSSETYDMDTLSQTCPDGIYNQDGTIECRSN